MKCNDKLITFGKIRTPNPTLSNSTTTTSTLSNQSLINKIQIFNPFNLNDNSTDCFTITGTLYSKLIQKRKCTCLLSNPNTNNSNNKNSNFITPTNRVDDTVSSTIDIINTGDAQQMALLNKTQRNTIKRLEVLKKIAIKFNKKENDQKSTTTNTSAASSSSTSSSNCLINRSQKHCVVHSNSMQMFILDINELLEDELKEQPIVNWQIPVAHFYQTPPDTILYSLILGIDEIILFGGMESDSPLKNQAKSYNDYSKNRISNKLYVMKAFV